MWGTCGILYNKVHVPINDAQTWGTLWNRKYQGKLTMKDSYRDSYGTALIWAHRKDLEVGKVTVPQLMNDYSPAAVAAVEKELKALEAKHRRMGSRLRQGDHDQRQSLSQYDLER